MIKFPADSFMARSWKPKDWNERRAYTLLVVNTLDKRGNSRQDCYDHDILKHAWPSIMADCWSFLWRRWPSISARLTCLFYTSELIKITNNAIHKSWGGGKCQFMSAVSGLESGSFLCSEVEPVNSIWVHGVKSQPPWYCPKLGWLSSVNPMNY